MLGLGANDEGAGARAGAGEAAFGVLPFWKRRVCELKVLYDGANCEGRVRTMLRCDDLTAASSPVATSRANVVRIIVFVLWWFLPVEISSKHRQAEGVAMQTKAACHPVLTSHSPPDRVISFDQLLATFSDYGLL